MLAFHPHFLISLFPVICLKLPITRTFFNLPRRFRCPGAQIFWTVLLKAHACFDGSEYLSWKIVKYCILSEVCMIKTAPHITVSPQMWCIKSMKCWFTRTQICWQDFDKYTCRTQKIRPDLFSKNSFSRPDLLWSRAIMALQCDRRWLLFFGCTYKAINSM